MKGEKAENEKVAEPPITLLPPLELNKTNATVAEADDDDPQEEAPVRISLLGNKTVEEKIEMPVLEKEPWKWQIYFKKPANGEMALELLMLGIENGINRKKYKKDKKFSISFVEGPANDWSAYRIECSDMKKT